MSIFKRLVLIICLAAAVFSLPAPEAEAIDPITIAILAPIAIKVAQYMAPYVIKGLVNMGQGMLEMGVEMVQIFRLPLGIGKLIFLGPFGYFHSGLLDIVEGGIAPFKLCLHALILPIRPFGAVF